MCPSEAPASRPAAKLARLPQGSHACTQQSPGHPPHSRQSRGSCMLRNEVSAFYITTGHQQIPGVC